jgi:hypothetical protein
MQSGIGPMQGQANDPNLEEKLLTHKSFHFRKMPAWMPSKYAEPEDVGLRGAMTEHGFEVRISFWLVDSSVLI